MQDAGCSNQGLFSQHTLIEVLITCQALFLRSLQMFSSHNSLMGWVLFLLPFYFPRILSVQHNQHGMNMVGEGVMNN